ncbi:TRAP transporter small permease [Spiractinospora alimapuensis]|uniref:TRAP transporter small permease n=1 Tax=Spiractinospora alimapuensis TaxID=2820884 RepID=UPI001F258688|nr:TRAP transporter small permease [Spiractinospora alimapuensis]QVQ50823.1 TRAP transporter small permease [Spiractinospora alimapuensis]
MKSSPPDAEPPSGDESEPLDLAERRFPWMRALMRVERVVAVVLLGLLLGLVLLQILSRYVLATPFVWTEEVARYALIWLTLLTIGLVAARRRHITARVFSRFLSPRATAALEITANAVVVVTSAVLVYVGWQFATSLATVNTPAAGISMAWIYGVSVPGFALVCFHTIVNSVIAWRHPETLRDDDAIAEGA